MSSTSKFDANTTFEDVAAAYPDQVRARTFLVTGATSGLGLEFCKSVAKHGAGTVIITGRSSERLQQALSGITAAGSDTIVKGILMELSDFDSVKKAAAEVNGLSIPIDVLINNAGIMAVPFKKVSGYESQFVTNHLGHFLFTNLVIGSLSPGARVLNITSRGHRTSPVRFDDINFKDGEEYNKWQAYGQSKSANILFSKYLNKKLSLMGGESFSIHPGAIRTGLADHLGPGEISPAVLAMVVGMEQGIATHLYGAISPDLKGKGGAYLAKCQVEEPLLPMTDEDAKKLWNLSNEILGTTF